jgi:outer membrane scaffolding protein for murein synthesis (MipA/OmpV family)
MDWITSMRASTLSLTRAWCVASVAFAQPAPPPPNTGWSFVVGGGGLLTPDYQGSDDYDVRALPLVSAKYDEWLTISFPEGVKAAFVNDGGFKLGVSAGFGFGRDESDNAALVGLGDIDSAVELGAFAEYRLGPVVFGLDARHDVAGAHDGTIARLSARFVLPFSGVRLGFVPQLTWADDNYTQTYFGISPAQAAASALGYAPYEANGGIKDYGLTAMAMIPLAEDWTLTAMAGVSQLTGDAAESPLVAGEGSETQFNAGIFIGYKF